MCSASLEFAIAIWQPIATMIVALLYWVGNKKWDHERLPDARLLISFSFGIPSLIYAICQYVLPVI